MTNLELENWVLEIASRVDKRQPIEDSRVEVKSIWPDDSATAARRLAGHGNSARGEFILWVIGLDERLGITGAQHEELANWFPRVQSQFNDIAPSLLKSLNVTAGKQTLVALLFDTTRFPYVVKNSKGGQIQFEVPWREGTAIRTASRTELVRLLSPLQRMPNFEVLRCNLRAWTNESILKWRMEMFLYVVSNSDHDVIIPNHRCHASFEIARFFPQTQLKSVWPDTFYNVRNSDNPPNNVRATGSEVIIQRAGMIILRGDAETKSPGDRSEIAGEISASVATITVQLLPTQVDASAMILAQLPVFVQKNMPDTWGMWQNASEEYSG